MSPKGAYRLLGFAIVGAILLLVSSLNNGSSQYVWLWETINFLGKATAGVALFYWAGRHVAHTRTHKLEGQDKRDRENIMYLGLAIIIGCALI